MAKIFLTGATGYIGGDVLHALVTTHPEYEITAAVRDSKRGDKISAAYPNVQIVVEDLDSSELIEDEARKADIVIHAASASHIQSVEAIARGFSKRESTKPAHWIQVSGASVLSMQEIEAGTYGEPSDKIYDDLNGAREVKALIQRYSSKRVVDNYILNIADKSAGNQFNTALIFPPIIYGVGRGQIKQRSYQVPELARVTIQRGYGVRVGRGLSRWSHVHINDVSDVFLKLVENAISGVGDRLWNEDGLYFTESGELTFGEISELVAAAAHNTGLTQSGSVREIDRAEADELSPRGAILWGTNARERALRAREFLGWKPAGEKLEDQVPETVAVEASRLGIDAGRL